MTVVLTGERGDENGHRVAAGVGDATTSGVNKLADGFAPGALVPPWDWQ
jgi:hypothetical protein